MICKLPPRQKRRLMLKLEGDNVWVHGGGTLRSALTAAIEQYVPVNKQSDRAYIKQLIDDIKQCYVRYDLLPAEYFYFDFTEKNWNQRDTYLTDSGEDEALCKHIGYDKYLTDLSDKYHFYELAKPFFHRAIILFDEHINKKVFIEFCIETNRLFVKPLAGSEGDGSFVVDVMKESEANSLFEKLSESKKKWMVEGRIFQSEELAKWNASSVNTVRLPTFLNQNGFFILAPIFRTGRVGKTIDNTSAGGVFALIDQMTGMICSEGYDVYGHVYGKHPDSGIDFMNYQIPRWEELLSTAEKAHHSFPTHLYIAWDFALTDNGWELIEGNWGRFRGAQMAGKRGLKAQFFEYLNSETIR